MYLYIHYMHIFNIYIYIIDNSNNKTIIFDHFLQNFYYHIFYIFLKIKVRINITYFYKQSINNLKIMMKSEIHVFKKYFLKLITINLFLFFYFFINLLIIKSFLLHS